MEIEADFGSRKALPSDNLSLLPQIFMYRYLPPKNISRFSETISPLRLGKYYIPHRKIEISFQIEIFTLQSRVNSLIRTRSRLAYFKYTSRHNYLKIPLKIKRVQ